MADEAEEARAQAVRLLARAMQARDQGHHIFAEVLTASAQRSLENAEALEAVLATVTQAVQQPTAQQQQQIQPGKEPEPDVEAKLPDERKR